MTLFIVGLKDQAGERIADYARAEGFSVTQLENVDQLPDALQEGDRVATALVTAGDLITAMHSRTVPLNLEVLIVTPDGMAPTEYGAKVDGMRFTYLAHADALSFS